MTATSLEFYKLRHRYLFLMVTLFLMVEIIFLFMSMSKSISLNPENANWEALIVMFASMNGLFFPILMSVCVSRICDMEHKGDTWKLLLSLSIKPGEIYVAKYICACILMLWACTMQILFIALFGIGQGFENTMPIFLLAQFFVGMVVVNMAVIALQQWVSMMVKNQAFPIFLGMIGGFIGLTADLMPSGVRSFFIWSYYSKLSPVSLSYESEKLNFIVRDINSLFPLMVIVIIAGMILYLAGNFHLSRKEV